MITQGRKEIAVHCLRSARTGKALPPVVRPGVAPVGVDDAIVYGIPALTRTERLMQQEQDLPLSFFSRDCYDYSEGAF